MESIFSCAICTDTCVDPVTASCGQHNFCLQHLAEWISSNYSGSSAAPSCPVCRLPIQRSASELKVNIAVRDAIAYLAAQGSLPRDKSTGSDDAAASSASGASTTVTSPAASTAAASTSTSTGRGHGRGRGGSGLGGGSEESTTATTAAAVTTATSTTAPTSSYHPVVNDGIYMILVHDDTASGGTGSDFSFVQTPMALDVRGGEQTNNADVIWYPMHQGQNQKFRIARTGIPSTEPPRYTLTPLHTMTSTSSTSVYPSTGTPGTKQLDVSGGGTQEGTPVLSWDRHTGENQQWYIETVQPYGLCHRLLPCHAPHMAITCARYRYQAPNTERDGTGAPMRDGRPEACDPVCIAPRTDGDSLQYFSLFRV